jgi:azurin
MKHHRTRVVLNVVAALCIAGCGGKGEGTGRSTEAETVRVTLTADDQMKFDQNVLEVPAGTRVILTLEHVGKMSVEAMGHNFVLLEQGTDLDAFALAAASASQTEYIPARKLDRVVAHTRMLGGGESDTIVFLAPPAGTYRFICSFPGHYVMMRGDFIVRAAPAPQGGA